LQAGSLKRTAKSLALRGVKFSDALGSERVAGRILRGLRIGFQPPSGPVVYPGNAKAACCISVDFDATRPGRAPLNHAGTEALLALGEKYRIPMTWAICGKTAEEDERAYEMVLTSSVAHEIGVHTYSHVAVPNCTVEQLVDEVERCIRSLRLNQRPSTFVFPWNREGHFDVLRRLGFKAYRSADRAIGNPKRMENGLWNIPPVYYVDEKSYGAQSLITRYIDICLMYRSVFHLWLHPWSLLQKGNTFPLVERTLDPVFAHMSSLRGSGSMAVSTMGELARVSVDSERIREKKGNDGRASLSYPDSRDAADRSAHR